MDALPAVNRPPLRTPSPILGSGSLSLLPVRDCAPAPPKGGCLVRLQAEAPVFPAMTAPAAPARSRRTWRDPASGGRASPHCPHRHHAQQAGRTRGSTWVLRVAGRPQRHTQTPAAGNRRPNDTRSRPSPRPTRRHSPQPPQNPHPLSPACRRSLEADRTRPRSRPGPERQARNAVTASRTLALRPQPAWPPGHP
jgi:hypothetical protein